DARARASATNKRPCAEPVDPRPAGAYDRPIMTSKVLSEIFIKHGSGAREGDAVRLTRDADASLFVTMGSETLTINRVTMVEFTPEVLIATTHRHERFIIAYEDVRGVRFGKSEPGQAGY